MSALRILVPVKRVIDYAVCRSWKGSPTLTTDPADFGMYRSSRE